MGTKIHWVTGPWPGRLGLAAKPRGGDWLDDELMAWRREGADVVVSLLTSEEERGLNLSHEANAAKTAQMNFLAVPIEDRQVPRSDANFQSALERIELALANKKNVVVHCRQGVGRTGLVAACLLINHGWDPTPAIDLLSEARGIPVPETAEQRSWIHQYASKLHAGTKF